MALKKGPAIRAEWLWKWQRRGIIKVVSLLGTRVLLVTGNSRPAKTYHRLDKRKNVAKGTVRYWLGRGIILVPRWDPLKLHYDPTVDKEVQDDGLDEELKKRGMFRLKDGSVIVLIYQHLGSILLFQRQQWHIQLERYAPELQRLSEELARLEKRATQEIEVLEICQGRMEEISEILARIEIREKTANAILHLMRSQISLAISGLKNVLTSKPMESLRLGLPANLTGLKTYLTNAQQQLGRIGKIRPVIRRLGLAYSCLNEVLESLDTRNAEKASQLIVKTSGILERTLQALEQPEDKIRPPTT